MQAPIFRPFDRLNFSESVCFLTGEPAITQMQLFPAWLTERYGLADKPFKLLDERILSYSDITVPVSAEALTALSALDDEIRAGFEGGYAAVSQLPSLRLFQWIARVVYGLIHFETRSGIRQQRAAGEDFYFSSSIAHKFGNLQLMLQSLTRCVEIEGRQPWTLLVLPVENPDDSFSYRDEMNTLIFSLRMGDFGVICCLQDNEESLLYHRLLLDKIKGHTLRRIQFEEICARFFYSAYLFNRLPEYTVLPANDCIYLEAMPLRISSRPVYDSWQFKTYGQVLENFWKPWGFSLFEIIQNPERPMSFLLDQDDNFLLNPTVPGVA
jgi:hypothetical protein